MPKGIPNPLTGKKYKKKYSGMKKAPESCLQVTKDAWITKARAKKLLEMKKVRPNETIATWERRVRKYNIATEEEIQRKLDAKKYKYITVVRSKEVLRKFHKTKNQTIRVEFYEKEHDFLKYYGIILNYYSVKYGIRKTDLEISFSFYNKIVDVDRFNNICVLNNGNSNGILARFKKNGYLTELLNHQVFEKKESKTVATNTYKLSLSMTKLITNIYEKIAKLNTLKKHQYKGMFTPECEKEILEMNAEINDYLTRNKLQENVNQIK